MLATILFLSPQLARREELVDFFAFRPDTFGECQRIVQRAELLLHDEFLKIKASREGRGAK